MPASIIKMTIANKKYTAIPDEQYYKLINTTQEQTPAKLPQADKRGSREAFSTMAALIAQDVHNGRIEAGLTQVQLAEKAGLRPETISRIETAKHTPSTSTMRKIDKVLGI